MGLSRGLPRAQLSADDLSGLRILVADDHVMTARLIGDVLRAAGVGEVWIAGDGFKAMAQLSLRAPHILFTDWRMPGMDGLELTRRIRAAATKPDRAVPDPRLPVILVTGQTSRRDVEQARRAGVNEFVVKPFTPASLLSRIQLVLTRPREFIVSDVYVGPDRRRRMEINYGGPLRRASDPELIAEQVEREETRATIATELEAMRRLISARGGVDRATLQMAYRVAQHTRFRARQVRDAMVERVSAGLLDYVERVGGPDQCEPDVLERCFDAMRAVLASEGEAAEVCLPVVRELEAMIHRKLLRRQAA